MSGIKWTSTANPSQDDLTADKDKPSGKGKRFFPKDKIRKEAMESNSGGRGYCEWCKNYFCMDYIRNVKKSPFGQSMACIDCVKENNLQVIK